MATRSLISVLNNGLWNTIYCHYDGYPSNQMPILSNHYNTPELAMALIQLGDLSSLESSLEDCEVYGDTAKKTYAPPYKTDFYVYRFDGVKWECFCNNSKIA